MKKNVTFVKIVASICASKLKERSQKQKKELNQGEEESSEWVGDPSWYENVLYKVACLRKILVTFYVQIPDLRIS